MTDINYLIDKLLIHFQVSTISELALKLGIAQQSISSWRQRNSVNALKKKCIELGIYNEIFGDISGTIFNQHGTNSQQIQNQHNSGNGIKVEKVDSSNQVSEFQPLFDALVSVAKALKKEEILKSELTKLMSDLPLK